MSSRLGIDMIGVCVVYFCHDGEGNFLLSKRSSEARDEQGTWDVGGGAVELHATVEETLKKEIREEYCTEVLQYKFLGYRDVHRTKEGMPTHWLALDFQVRVNRATVRIGEPHKFDDLDWFRLNDLPSPLHSQLGPAFEDYRQRGLLGES